jgi:hypothetical protein
MRRFLLVVLSIIAALQSNARAGEIRQFWFYRSVNMLVDQNIGELAKLFERAGKAGYTHCLLTDSKFSRLHEMPERYFKNVEKVKAAAKQANVELVPALFSIGYSNDLLGQDPNLIEAMPVREMPLIVQGGVAQAADASPRLKNPDFSNPKGWDWQDPSVDVTKGSAVFREPKGKVSRVSQKLTFAPFRQYHIQLRIRCDKFEGVPEVKVITDNQILNYDYLKTEATQDWKTHHVVFNSGEHAGGSLYVGAWDGQNGSFECDDVVIEEVPFLNLVRRPGAPLVIKTAERKVLKEGEDYEKLVDPLMGTEPYGGCYTVYHEPPKLKCKLPDGTKLVASYYHAATVHDDQANICPSEPKTVEILRDEAQRVHKLFGAKGYMMSHDEIRVFNQCEACRARNLDAGAMLADNVRTCIQILREVNPDGRIYVWSDMFDPHHNARKDFFLARGDYTGSWEGLDKGVTIVPWYFEKRDESLKFFADRGHKQVIAGYYDDAPRKVRDWIAAAKPHDGVEAVMYTTWRADYSKLEEFIREAKAALK